MTMCFGVLVMSRVLRVEREYDQGQKNGWTIHLILKSQYIQMKEHFEGH